MNDELTLQKLDMLSKMHKKALYEYNVLQNKEDAKEPNDIKGLLEEKLCMVKQLEYLKKSVISNQSKQDAKKGDVVWYDSDTLALNSEISAVHRHMTYMDIANHDFIQSAHRELATSSIARSRSDAHLRLHHIKQHFPTNFIRINKHKMSQIEQTTSAHLLGSKSNFYVDENAENALTTLSEDNPSQQLGSRLKVISMDDEETVSDDDSNAADEAFIDLEWTEMTNSRMAIFLNFLLSSNSSSPLFFYEISGNFETISGSSKDLRRWAYELYTVFLAEKSPLKVDIDKELVANIDCLLNLKVEKEDHIRTIFLATRHAAYNICLGLLENFRNSDKNYKRYEIDAKISKQVETKVVSKYLQPHFDELQEMIQSKSVDDSTTRNSQTLLAAIVWFFNQCDYHASSSADSIPTFLTKDKKKLSSWSSKKSVTVKQHNLYLNQYSFTTLCHRCGEIIGGIGCVGYHCINCDLNYHGYCISQMTDPCPKQKSKRMTVIGDMLRIPVLQIDSKLSEENTHDINSTSNGDIDENKKLNGDHTRASSLSSSPLHGNSQVLLDDDSDFDVEPELPSTQKFVGEEVFKQLKTRERKKLDIINELFYTERTHVRNLKVLDRIFYQPLSRDPNVPEQLVSSLFPNLQEVIDVHVKFNNAMKKHKEESPLVPQIADILIQHFDGDSGQSLCQSSSRFCQDQSHALSYLKTTQHKDDRLNKLIKELASNPLCRRLQLKDLLPNEIQRLTKYPLLLQSLCKYTTVGTEEYCKLEFAIRKSKEILDNVNLAVRKQENSRLLADINKRFDRKQIDTQDVSVEEYRTLDLTQYELVRDGHLVWRLSGQKEVCVHAVLLPHIFILFQKQDEKLILKSHNMMISKENTKELQSPFIQLHDLIIRNVATDKKGFFLVNTSNTGPRIYELVAKSKEDKERWLKTIEETVKICKPAEDKKEVSDQSHPQFEPGDTEQITLTRTQISISSKDKKSSSSTSDEPSTVAKRPLHSDIDATIDELARSRLNNLDKDKSPDNSDNAELVHPEQIVVTQPQIIRAESFITPLEKVRRINSRIRNEIDDNDVVLKELIMADSVSNGADDPVISNGAQVGHKGRDELNLKNSLTLSLRLCRSLLSLLYKDVSLDDNKTSIQGNDSDEVRGASSEAESPPVSLDKMKLLMIANKMTETLTNAMSEAKKNDQKRFRLEDELYATKMQLRELQQSYEFLSSVNESKKFSIPVINSSLYDDVNVYDNLDSDPVVLLRAGSLHSSGSRRVDDEDDSDEESEQFHDAESQQNIAAESRQNINAESRPLNHLVSSSYNLSSSVESPDSSTPSYTVTYNINSSISSPGTNQELPDEVFHSPKYEIDKKVTITFDDDNAVTITGDSNS